jgi:hypothetical protein
MCGLPRPRETGSSNRTFVTGANERRLKRGLRRLHAGHATRALRHRGHEPVSLVVTAEELALALVVTTKQQQMPLGALDVDYFEIDGVTAADEADLEQLASAVRAHVDLWGATAVAGDLDPSPDGGESPLECLGLHLTSFLAADDQLGRAGRQEPRLSVHLPRTGDRRTGRRQARPHAAAMGVDPRARTRERLV